ncbi:MAG: phosphoenolpyruvate--protein phosphotransferase [Alphaproteobacteria bacterium]|nr:phosphoenolpyruvate--protein phosphotransferase [Alphaproteobacteria bacterium]
MASIIPIDPANPAILAPISLLRQVRDAMKSSVGTAQSRLDNLVRTIAKTLHADVCSIYLARPGDILELYASYGLNQTSVHVTRLRFGEGLVGEVAASGLDLNLAEAKIHPKFAYRPETGEEMYHSFIGVPLLHSHKTIGVLVVQSKAPRAYSNDLAEIMHAVSMVISELAVGSKIVDLYDISGGENPTLQSQQVSGITLAGGIAKAPVVLHRPKIDITELVSESPEEEEMRFHGALLSLQQSVDTLIDAAGLEEGSAHREILESYRLFSQDRGWIDRILEAIRAGLTAEAAVRKVQEEMHARLSQITSAYIQERVHDLEDLSERLLYHLQGIEPTAALGVLPDAFILVATSLGPAELLEYDAQRLKGVILAEGAPTSHVAIIARMMDIPMVGRVENILNQVTAGDLAVVQGDQGLIYIRPPEDVEAAADAEIAARASQVAAYAATRDLPSLTRDGLRISLNLNLGLFVHADHLNAADVDGVGLFRTELPYMASRELPSVGDQQRIYRDAIEKAKGKPVIFRSFDIGGDKQVPYIQAGDEENPAMGWRATRIGLDRPVILRQQLRALVRAAAGEKLSVMFPFIAEIPEFDAMKALLNKELARARDEGITPPTDIRVGTMLEIPSLLFQLPELMSRVDFISIGSNDLFQFLFACDRGSPRVSGRYDTLSPAVIRAVKSIVAAANEYRVELGFCGDMATRPVDAMALIGCGVRALSMPPAAIGPVKAMVRTLNAGDLAHYLEYICTEPLHSIRLPLERYARDHGVEID